MRKAKATLPAQEEGSYLSLLGGSFLSIVDSSDICMNHRVYIATCVALFFIRGPNMANITVSAKKVREFMAIEGSKKGDYDHKSKSYSSSFEYSVNLRFNAKANRFTVRVSNVYIYAVKAKDGSIKLVKSDNKFNGYAEASKEFAEGRRDDSFKRAVKFLVSVGFTKMTWEELLSMARDNGFDTNVVEKVVQVKRAKNAKEKAERLSKKEESEKKSA